MASPIAAARSFIGLAKEGTHTVLASAVAASATSLVVESAAGISTSSTVFIMDGTLSESRAVTGVSSNTLTVSALTNAHGAGAYILVQPTASAGPTDYLVVTGLEIKDTPTQLYDQGVRGSNVSNYGAQQGPIIGEISLSGNVHPDTIGYLLGCMLGAADFSSGTPNTHTFSSMNTAASNGQGPSYCFYDYDGDVCRAISGVRFSELAFKFTPSGLLTFSAKGMGNPTALVSVPSPSFSAVKPLPAWTGATSVGGTPTLRFVDADFTFRRNVASPPVIGMQGPFAVFGGALETVGSYTAIATTGEAEVGALLANTQPSLDFAFLPNGRTDGVTFHCSTANYEQAVKQQTGNPWVQVAVTWGGIANTSDATTAGGGYSPGKVILKSSKATGVYA